MARVFLICAACVACGSAHSDPNADGSPGSGGLAGLGGAASTQHGNAGSKHSGGSGNVGTEDSPSQLWYGGVSLCAFDQDQLHASAEAAPRVIVPISTLTAVLDVAFDAQGNAWVVGSNSDHLFRFSAQSLAKPASAKPDLVVASTALKNPANLAVDENGGLWVATRPPIDDGRVEQGSILRFDVPEGSSGSISLSPTTELSSATDGDLNLIGNINFDGAQNLWVSSLAGLLRFDKPNSEEGKLSLEPSAVIERTGYSNNIFFYSVAFDSNGALWTASGDGLHYLTSITGFEDPSALEGRSSPEAFATIRGREDVLPAGGLAFDDHGNLWMARGNGLVMYSDPGSLKGDVDPEPDLTFTVKGDALPSTNSHLLFMPPLQGSKPD